MYSKPKSQKRTKAGNGPKTNHVFRNVRDPVVIDANAATPTIANIVTDGGGNSDTALSFSPLGLQTVKDLDTATPSSQFLETPRLGWLHNTARNFSSYRILRANLVYTSLLGSTATGRIAFYSSTDFADGVTLATLGNMPNARVVDLAMGASKEIRYNLTVDSSWKKVSSQTLSIVTGYGPNLLLNFNTVNDIIFSQLSVVVAGGPVSSAVGSLSIEYDVEFKGPIGIGLNF